MGELVVGRSDCWGARSATDLYPGQLHHPHFYARTHTGEVVYFHGEPFSSNENNPSVHTASYCYSRCPCRERERKRKPGLDLSRLTESRASISPINSFLDQPFHHLRSTDVHGPGNYRFANCLSKNGAGDNSFRAEAQFSMPRLEKQSRGERWRKEWERGERGEALQKVVPTKFIAPTKCCSL